MDMTVGEIAALIGGAVHGDASIRLTGISGIREAGPNDLAFFSADSPYSRNLATTNAGAVIVPMTVTEAGQPIIRVEEPRVAVLLLLQRLEAELAWRPQGVHSGAVLHPSVTLGNGASVDAMAYVAEGSVLEGAVTIHAGATIGRNCRIGQQTVIYQNVTIGDRVVIGARCVIHPGAVLGADGFGFAEQGGIQIKIPQVGTVIVGDDVEIGANTCIDRATIGATVIGSGTKIDNLVQIGHNVQLGRNCIVCGKVGIAGSAVLGDNVTIGAMAGVAGHIEIGDRAKVAGYAGVTKSVKPGAIVAGFPAGDITRHRRKEAALRQLPDALRRIKTLEQRLAQLEGTLNGTPKDDR